MGARRIRYSLHTGVFIFRFAVQPAPPFLRAPKVYASLMICTRSRAGSFLSARYSPRNESVCQKILPPAVLIIPRSLFPSRIAIFQSAFETFALIFRPFRVHFASPPCAEATHERASSLHLSPRRGDVPLHEHPHDVEHNHRTDKRQKPPADSIFTSHARTSTPSRNVVRSHNCPLVWYDS